MKEEMAFEIKIFKERSDLQKLRDRDYFRVVGVDYCYKVKGDSDYPIKAGDEIKINDSTIVITETDGYGGFKGRVIQEEDYE